MPYLTYEEYNDFLFVELDEAEFDRLISRASDVLDAVTRNFYIFNKLNDDIEFRKTKFKKALSCQIEYFHEMGATSSHGLDEDAAVSIGRTSTSKGSRSSKSNATAQNSVMSKDIYMHLGGTGLLYRGLGVV